MLSCSVNCLLSISKKTRKAWWLYSVSTCTLIGADLQKTISACIWVMDAGVVAKSIGYTVVVVLYVRYNYDTKVVWGSLDGCRDRWAWWWWRWTMDGSRAVNVMGDVLMVLVVLVVRYCWQTGKWIHLSILYNNMSWKCSIWL